MQYGAARNRRRDRVSAAPAAGPAFERGKIEFVIRAVLCDGAFAVILLEPKVACFAVATGINAIA